MFITKINLNADLIQIKQDLDTVLSLSEWGVENQIGLVHRPITKNNLWKDCVGSLYNRETDEELFKETEFTELNKDVPEYTKGLLLSLAQQCNFRLGRVRYMRLMPKTGLTVHEDTSERYHLVIDTNPFSYMVQVLHTGHVAGVCYKMHSDSYFYKVDTTKSHFVYNGGTTPRIHLVICPV